MRFCNIEYGPFPFPGLASPFDPTSRSGVTFSLAGRAERYGALPFSNHQKCGPATRPL
jgi:hypothetical protein